MSSNARRLELLQQRGFSVNEIASKDYKKCNKPISPASEYNYTRVKLIWRQYLLDFGHSQEEIQDTMREDAPLPSINTVKQFIRYYACSTKGHLGQFPTRSTILDRYYKLTTFLERECYRKFTQAYHDDMTGVRYAILRYKNSTQLLILCSLLTRSSHRQSRYRTS